MGLDLESLKQQVIQETEECFGYFNTVTDSVFVFTSRVTDDIVAMARPSTTLIKEYNIIEQFTK